MDKRTLPDLTRNSKSVTLILSSGSIGYAPIPNDVQKIGVITSSSLVRMALNAVPSSASTVAGGSAVITTFQTGVPLSGSPIGTINWFELGFGTDRSLYFKGATSLPQITIIYV